MPTAERTERRGERCSGAVPVGHLLEIKWIRPKMEVSMDTLLILGLIWSGLAIAIAAYADGHGRDALGWYVLAMVFSPPLVALFLFGKTSQRDW